MSVQINWKFKWVQSKKRYRKAVRKQLCQQLSCCSVSLPCQPDMFLLISKEPGWPGLLAFCFKLAESWDFFFFSLSKRAEFYWIILHIVCFKPGNLSVFYCPEVPLSSELCSYLFMEALCDFFTVYCLVTERVEELYVLYKSREEWKESRHRYAVPNIHIKIILSVKNCLKKLKQKTTPQNLNQALKWKV